MSIAIDTATAGGNGRRASVAMASVDATNDSGETALVEAASAGRSDCLDVLVAAGADVDHAEQNGWHALHAAIFHGNRLDACVERLVRAGS